MSELRYAAAALRGDYIRAATGLVLTLGPLLALPWPSPALYVLGPAAALFGLFAFRTWRRQRTRVVIGADGISLFGGQEVSLGWTEIRSVRLSYFSTRRDRTGGWMQLTLKGGNPQRRGRLRTIRVDSTLADFATVARLAAGAAEALQLPLPDATRANFAAMGISTGEIALAAAADRRPT